VNACIGLAECLRDRGHKIAFAIDPTFKGKLISYRFIEELLIDPNAGKFKNDEEQGANHLIESGIMARMSSLEKMELMSKQPYFIELIEIVMTNEQRVKAIIEKHKPDLYVIDHFIGSPTLIYSDKTYIFS
jgi:UDP:flavonoid glycosyltransferase YjiC (YdhE family)